MLGMVLAKEKRSQVAQTIVKAEPKHKKEEVVHAHKKQSVDTIGEYIAKVQHQEKKRIPKKPAEDSPKTSVESSENVRPHIVRKLPKVEAYCQKKGTKLAMNCLTG